MVKTILQLIILLHIGKHYVMGSLGALKAGNFKNSSTDKTEDANLIDFQVSDGKCHRRKETHTLSTSEEFQDNIGIMPKAPNVESTAHPRSTVDKTETAVQEVIFAHL
ncbi:hypothetical protein PTTG_12231 [Puccinia triticina 1-1 BBBD Race 1]|uniref:Uncharacterized protein n=2 Tax=Puccinia triticina TaxID=208348 RepID=A0A180GU84_PUCT1|nr:uncharacterized protein PtA15_11A441 [Puccinia triticina]OAV95862.1 hypothetical protein PTTG_12231 [Puccinia triticina 1-1 BBBD Race 1]UQE85739.1 hypothetical protein [Puccinia triticina]WAQ89750.1 hypothetical protein PtA15_11A441 [Puccinia triticina]WAR59799.1 hypothetical protein PtB15_11B440 [Puccinia triticina]